MDKIKDLFSANLRRLRGNRTQAEIAEMASIPFRTYQNAELGKIPHGPSLSAIAKAFDIPETLLFADHNRMSKITELIALLPTLNDSQIGRLLEQAKFEDPTAPTTNQIAAEALKHMSDLSPKKKHRV